MIMETTIEQQTALDESFVPSLQRLRIGRCNFRLPSDIQSEEETAKDDEELKETGIGGDDVRESGGE
nr:hypothetical protein [Tanacetum cinerariifolium]